MAGGVISAAGSGYGSGSGYGYGSGYGDGYGDGYGSGSGSGYGDGYGDGVKIAAVPSGDVVVKAPFPVVQVGCQVHTIEHWRSEWAEIASGHDDPTTSERAAEIIALAESVLREV